MIDTVIYDAVHKPTQLEINNIVNFLHESLEQYGDPKHDIEKAINYSIKLSSNNGGFTLAMRDKQKIIGVVVINKTGMSGYIPENILVYIAMDKNYRGQGIGKELMTKAISLTKGDIALHVEPENPARKLYEKLGFTAPYIEMRLKK